MLFQSDLTSWIFLDPVIFCWSNRQIGHIVLPFDMFLIFEICIGFANGFSLWRNYFGFDREGRSVWRGTGDGRRVFCRSPVSRLRSYSPDINSLIQYGITQRGVESIRSHQVDFGSDQGFQIIFQADELKQSNGLVEFHQEINITAVCCFATRDRSEDSQGFHGKLIQISLMFVEKEGDGI